MHQSKIRTLASEIFYASLKAVDPYDSVKGYAEKVLSVYRNGNFRRLVIIAFGKAACPMAKALEDNLGNIIDTGILITKYGHCPSPLITSEEGGKASFPKIKIYEAGHPVPDEYGLKGTDEIMKLLKNTDALTLVVCLISGGGSALLVSPYESITLHQKQEITQLLLKAGADINALNCVRKHISRVKGCRLAEIAHPAKIISLILSDVVGDRLDVIASGPTSPDTTTYADALQVLERYAVKDKAPKNIIEVLSKGAKGLIPETPKKGDNISDNIENIIIGSNKIALKAAKRTAEELGFRTDIISSELTGEAREAGRWLAARLREHKIRKAERIREPLCLISGGETTVTVHGSGKGGRNMELALAFAIEIEGMDGVTLLSAGTDGTDGPTDATGAFADSETVKTAKGAGVDPMEYLNNNDSYNFFKKTDGLFITGPTGTNVMDIQIALMN